MGTAGGWDVTHPCSMICLKPVHQSPAVPFFRQILLSFSAADSALHVQNFHSYVAPSTGSVPEICEDREERRALPERLHPLCALHPLLWLLLFFCSSHWGQFLNCQRSPDCLELAVVLYHHLSYINLQPKINGVTALNVRNHGLWQFCSQTLYMCI